MADLVPPEDLVALKAAWLAADARARRLAAVEPAGDTTIPRRPPANQQDQKPEPPIRLLSEEQNIALGTARAERLELTLRLARHPWKSGQSDVRAAENALNDAATALWTEQEQENAKTA